MVDKPPVKAAAAPRGAVSQAALIAKALEKIAKLQEAKAKDWASLAHKKLQDLKQDFDTYYALITLSGEVHNAAKAFMEVIPEFQRGLMAKHVEKTQKYL